MKHTLIAPTVATLAVLIAALAVEGGQLPSMKDPKIASRVLLDADLEKYVAVLSALTRANRERGGKMTPEALREVDSKKAKACETQGWSTLDFGAVDARMNVALMHLKMERTLPIPDSKKADADIARRFQAKIDAAKR